MRYIITGLGSWASASWIQIENEGGKPTMRQVRLTYNV